MKCPDCGGPYLSRKSYAASPTVAVQDRQCSECGRRGVSVTTCIQHEESAYHFRSKLVNREINLQVGDVSFRGELTYTCEGWTVSSPPTQRSSLPEDRDQ